MEEETRLTKALTLEQQGKWLNWEDVQQRKLTWDDIWAMEGDILSFLLKPVYDVLPSTTNLKTKGAYPRVQTANSVAAQRTWCMC